MATPTDFCLLPRLRVCFVHWEYRQLPHAWTDALNQHFDLVVAPSQASQALYLESGLKIPSVVFPAAVDTAEFHPNVRPWNAPTVKSFRFIHLGGAHARRGTDLVLAAFAAEFTTHDDVALVLKAFHYEHHRAWLERQLARRSSPVRRRLCICTRRSTRSHPSLRRAMWASISLRAECFGLPVLECIASGRRVIVTEKTALDEFCTRENADFVQARVVSKGDGTFAEPTCQSAGAHARSIYARQTPCGTARACGGNCGTKYVGAQS